MKNITLSHSILAVAVLLAAMSFDTDLVSAGNGWNHDWCSVQSGCNPESYQHRVPEGFLPHNVQLSFGGDFPKQVQLYANKDRESQGWELINFWPYDPTQPVTVKKNDPAAPPLLMSFWTDGPPETVPAVEDDGGTVVEPVEQAQVYSTYLPMAWSGFAWLSVPGSPPIGVLP